MSGGGRDRLELLELYGGLYGRLRLAIAFTESTEGDAAKRCRNNWPRTTPLADCPYGAALLKGRGPRHNPAVVLRPSRLVGLECDTPEGLEQLQALGLPATVTVQSSAPHKVHFWFRPPAVDPEFVAFRFEQRGVTGDRGRYLLVPPALHPSGRVYAFLRSPEDTEIAALPRDAYEELVRLSSRDGQVRRQLDADPDTPVVEGARNQALTSMAGAMRRRGMAEASIAAALLEENARRCQPPLDEDEVRGIAASVARYRPDEQATPEQETPEDEAGEIRLQVLTARELAALPDPPVSDELLGTVLVRGHRTIVGGHTGEGKTTFALGMIRAVVEGEHFLGWAGIGGRRVLVVDLEQGLRTVKRRLRETGLDRTDQVDYVRVPDGLMLDKSERQRAALAAVLDRGGYDVVLLDPEYKAHGGDSNSEQEKRALMGVLDAWRTQHHFALLLPAHCRKPPPGTKFSIHDIFGSTVLVRGAEVVLGLQRVNDGYSRLHFFKDRDGDLPIGRSWALLFDIDDGYRRDPKDDEEPRDLEHDVRAFIEARRGEWLTARDVAKKEDEGGIGASRKKVEAILEAWRQAGEVEYAKGPPGRNARADCYRLGQLDRPSDPTDPTDFAQGSLEGSWIAGLAGSIEPVQRDPTDPTPQSDWLERSEPAEPTDGSVEADEP